MQIPPTDSVNKARNIIFCSMALMMYYKGQTSSVY